MINRLSLKKNKWFKIVLISITLLLFNSCRKEYQMPEEIAAVKTNIQVDRFDQEFNNVDVQQLQKLKSGYPFLFSTEVTDEFWVKKSKYTLQQELITEIKKVFPLNDDLKNELERMYKYLKYYYPQINEPRIIGLVGEVDYRNRVRLTKE